MKIFRDLPTLVHMIFPPSRRGTQQERMEALYHTQAETYDDFRRREMGRSGQKFVQNHFTERRMAYEMLGVFEKAKSGQSVSAMV